MGLRLLPRVVTMACCFVFVAVASAQVPQQGTPRNADARQPQAERRPQGMPDWYPLHPDLKKHTDNVLKFWEFHSSKIERYRSDFERWEYDRQNFHPTEPLTFAKGKVNYAKPDKGLFEVTSLRQGRKTAGGKIEYVDQQNAEFEKWICDGKTLFEFDHRNKQLIERGLPPEMQGEQIVEGPLPFLFGAKKAQIEARYWVRINPKPPVKGVFWLEAVPKRREDAANFKKVEIVIPDEDKFLPKAIILHHRGGTQTTFEFVNRENDWNDTFEKLAVWNRAFFNPATPLGWKRVRQPASQQQTAQPRSRAPGLQQAQNRLPPRSTR